MTSSSPPTAGPSPDGTLGAQRYLDLIEAEAERFAAVARSLPPSARSRTYPGYDAGSLTAHVGSVLARTKHTVRTGEILTDTNELVPPAQRAPADWLEDSARELVEVGRCSDPTRQVPTFPFGEVKPLTALYRSTVTEVAIHRWDLESAGGDHAPLATDLSVDVIDSIFEWWAPVLLAERRIGLFLGGTLVLEAVDADVRWVVTVDGGTLIGHRAEGPVAADAVLSGPAHLVLLTVWKRLPVDPAHLSVAGDETLIDRFLRIPYIPDPQITAAH